MFRSKDSRFSICHSTENAASTSGTERSIVVNVKEVVPVDNKVPLLRWGYRAASEGSINIKCRSFGILWCIDEDISYVVECTPITSKVLYINLIID